MDRELTVTEDTQLMIYGAGLKGQVFYEIAQELGLTVAAFLDRNAGSIADRNGVAALTPDSGDIPAGRKEEALVLISVNDVFAHEEIADALYRCGFRFILYKPNLMRKLSPEEAVRSDMYDAYYLDRRLLGSRIQPYSPSGQMRQGRRAFVRETGSHYIAYLPAELLYANSETAFLKRYQGIDDRMEDTASVFSYVYCGDLFRGYESGLEGRRWERFLDVYRRGGFSYLKEPEGGAEFERHLKNRYKLYQAMTAAFHENPLFFEQSPVIVECNSHNRLVIKDGTNRTAFLLAKGLFWIPCRIEKETYRNIYKEKDAETVLDYLEEQGIKELPLPVTHCCFRGFPFRHGIYAQKVLQVICRHIQESGRQDNNRCYLDVNSRNGYYAQFFAASGYSVTAVEPDRAMAEVFGRLNRLLGCEDIHIVEDIPQADGGIGTAFLHDMENQEGLLEKCLNQGGLLRQAAESGRLFAEVEEGGRCESWLRENGYGGSSELARLAVEGRMRRIIMVLRDGGCIPPNTPAE